VILSCSGSLSRKKVNALRITHYALRITHYASQAQKNQSMEAASSKAFMDWKNKARPERSVPALKWIKQSMLISFCGDQRDDVCDACGLPFFSYAIF
jgi:hypothetical protein